MLKKIPSSIIFIFIAFFLSLTLSVIYIYIYDSYHLNGYSHIMLKEETFAHWYKGAKILQQIENGSNIFEAGEEMFTKPLPQRIVAIYSYLLNFEIIENWETLKITLGNKLPFLFLQSTLYYFSVYIFYLQISKIFEKKTTLIIIIFLCIEPTIFQYHSSFWTESFYFSLQLLLFSFMLEINKNKKHFLLLGLLLALLFMQRSAGIFYVVVVVLYYFFNLKEDKYKKISLLLLSYMTICLILGFHNYKRAGIFYIMPLEGKYGMYKYFAKDILVTSKNETMDQINASEVKKAVKWIKNELPELDYKKYQNFGSPFEIGFSIQNEKYKTIFYGYLNKRSYEILLNNPIITFKKIIKGFIHFSVLNPFFVFYDYEYYKEFSSSEIGDFTFSETHSKLIPTRIIYSLLIILFSLIGFSICLKKYPKIFFLILMSIVYYYLILGWYGKTRLFVPNLIYVSIFFSLGLKYSLKKINLIKE